MNISGNMSNIGFVRMQKECKEIMTSAEVSLFVSNIVQHDCFALAQGEWSDNRTGK